MLIGAPARIGVPVRRCVSGPGHKCRGHGDGHWTCHRTWTSRLQTGESLLFLTLVNAAKRRAAFHGQRLPEWNRVCIGGDEQARGVRSVAPRVIDPADDRRVTRVHQHLVDVGDEVDLATHARTCCSPACPCGVMALPPRVGFPMRGRPIRSGTVLALPNQASAIGRRRRCCRRGSLESPTAWRSRRTPRIARSSVRAARPPSGCERRDRPRTCSHV